MRIPSVMERVLGSKKFALAVALIAILMGASLIGIWAYRGQVSPAVIIRSLTRKLSVRSPSGETLSVEITCRLEKTSPKVQFVMQRHVLLINGTPVLALSYVMSVRISYTKVSEAYLDVILWYGAYYNPMTGSMVTHMLASRHYNITAMPNGTTLTDLIWLASSNAFVDMVYGGWGVSWNNTYGVFYLEVYISAKGSLTGIHMTSHGITGTVVVQVAWTVEYITVEASFIIFTLLALLVAIPVCTDVAEKARREFERDVYELGIYCR